MDLTQHLHPDLILVRPDTRDKWELLETLSRMIEEGPFSNYCEAVPSGEIRNLVIKREHERSTAMGKGLAMPHARIPGLQQFLVALALLPDGIEFDAPDGQPVQVVCLVVTPAENPTIALRVFAAIATVFSDRAVARVLMQVRNPNDICSFLAARQIPLHMSVTARDVMRPPRLVVHPETALRDVTRDMLTYHVESVPVLDAADNVVGEITCDRLYQKGVPDFFRQLQTVSFIPHFDPFEKYFESEVNACARDIMSKEFCTMNETATLLEVVFALSVQKHPKIYIVHDRKLVGIVDNIAVLDRILNL